MLIEANIDDGSSKNVMEITLNIEKMDIHWQPGDTIAIIPTNSNKDVEMLLHCLCLTNEADMKCLISVNPSNTKKTAKIPIHIPTQSTARELLRDCINIRAVLKKQFLSALSGYCTDNDEKTFLKCLSSKEGSSLYNQLIITRNFVLLDILEICPSCRPPLNLIIEHMPRLLPRPYSIANSSLVGYNSNEITIILSILNDKPGVTSGMLLNKSQENEASILMYLREPNAFRYTEEDYRNNQILIAIGTGLAPFLGFLQHKQRLKETMAEATAGETWLFVGATTEKAILHREQLLDWESTHVLNKFLEAHSRSSLTNLKYVQDSLLEYAHEVYQLLKQPETNLYLCADGGEITKTIEVSIENIIQKELLVSATEAQQILKEYKANGKYRIDLWL